MKNSIEMENVCVSFSKKEVLKDLNWKVKENTFTVLVGKNGSGKTTLLRSLLHLIDYRGTIKIKGEEINKKNQKAIYQKIGIVFDDVNASFLCETVFDELMSILKGIGYKNQEAQKKIKDLTKELSIEHLQSKMICHLSGGEKQVVAFASAIMKEPEILLLDEPFTMIDSKAKADLMEYVKQYQRKHKNTVILITNDVEDTVNATDIAILKDGKIKKQGTRNTMLKNEKIWKEAELSLPFMAELSLKLKYYGLLDEPILDIKEMVGYLWK